MASSTSRWTDCRNQSTSLFLSPGYRATSPGNRSRRRATALMGPAESARNSAYELPPSPRS
eukprot:13026080-Alexandrium_andersonii.AAC.1